MGLNVSITCTCDECHVPYQRDDLVTWKEKAYKILRKCGWSVTTRTDQATYRSTIRILCPSCRRQKLRARMS